MQYLMHNYEEMIAAPLWIGRHKFGHDGVDFLDNIHTKKFFQLDFSWCNDGADNFQGCCIKLDVAHLEILEQYLH